MATWPVGTALSSCKAAARSRLAGAAPGHEALPTHLSLTLTPWWPTGPPCGPGLRAACRLSAGDRFPGLSPGHKCCALHGQTSPALPRSSPCGLGTWLGAPGGPRPGSGAANLRGTCQERLGLEEPAGAPAGPPRPAACALPDSRIVLRRTSTARGSKSALGSKLTRYQKAHFLRGAGSRQHSRGAEFITAASFFEVNVTGLGGLQSTATSSPSRAQTRE